MLLGATIKRHNWKELTIAIEGFKQKRISSLVAISVVLLGYFSVRTVANGPVRIMPLGDSITYGTGSTNNNGYRKPLYLTLTATDCNFDFVGSIPQIDADFPDPNHEGHSGWHADGCPLPYPPFGDVLDHVYGWLTVNPADIVLLHIGTNDITYGGQSADEVNDILNEIDRYSPDVKVTLALIIDRKTHNEATTQFNIDVNNMAQSRIAAGDDIVVVDMEHELNATDMDDELHPNNNGYDKMADVWFDALDNVINPPLITSEPITDAIVSQLYSYDVNVDANCYPEPTYMLTVCPNDMTIDYNTGLIEWLPTTVGDFNVTVEVSNGQPPDANQSFVVTADHTIEFDAASSNAGGSDGNTLNWQHTIGDGNNRILVVGIAGEDDDVSDLVTSSVMYNDINMTLVEDSSITVSSGDPIYHMKTELYYLLDANLPSLPGKYTVTVTYNGNIMKRCGGAISLANVEQDVREAVATSSNVDQNTISTSITTQTDNAWLVDVVGCGDTGSFLTNAGGMTERFDVNSDSSAAAGSTKPVVPAQETTISWTHSSANRLAHSVAAFAPASYIIAGYISEINYAPIEGVLVSADAYATDTTDPNGYYEVFVHPSWSGTVTPTKDGTLFAPSNRTYGSVTNDLFDQDYADITIYDLYSDGIIDWLDLKIICDNWLTTAPEPDLNGDNIVDFLDFADFALAW